MYGLNRAYTELMKQPEYVEGPKALENFERGMIALFKVPKKAIGEARKEGRKLTAPKKRKRGKD
jgi:hypothetical protein